MRSRGAIPASSRFGSGGVGTTTHLAPELLQSLTGIKMVHVPYKGSGQALVGMIGGEVDMLIMAAPAAASQIQAGRARAIAVLSAQRAVVIPDVPTAAEAGLQNFEVPIWYGILAPAATPREIIARLNGELIKALTSPDLKERLGAAGNRAQNEHARRIRGVYPQRDRALCESHQRRRHQAGIRI